MKRHVDLKTWQAGPAAISLLVIYAFVLQGVFSSPAMGGQGSLFLSKTLCLSQPADTIDSKPVVPSRHSRHDGCCAFHLIADGSLIAKASDVTLVPPHLSSNTDKLRSSVNRDLNKGTILPLGSRAPPCLI
ncbi:MAG: hypothetical protein EB015_04235 [Methylocystaceae bacterium]|jgi:hypothetical protein|nr:hypothetical protein [Methylocystaceae bacterium]